MATALLALALCLVSSLAANGQAYPERVVKIIAPYTPGSPNDVLARLVAQDLQSRLGQPFIIDNKPGGGTSIGTKVFAMSPPDGYTLLLSSSSLIIDPILNRRTEPDPAQRFVPIATVSTSPWLLAQSKQIILGIAGDYERMAELAEQRVKSGGLPSAPWPG